MTFAYCAVTPATNRKFTFLLIFLPVRIALLNCGTRTNAAITTPLLTVHNVAHATRSLMNSRMIVLLPRCPAFHCAMPAEKSMKTHWTADFMRSRLPARSVARRCLFMKKIGLLTIQPRHWMPASTPCKRGKISRGQGDWWLSPVV